MDAALELLARVIIRLHVSGPVLLGFPRPVKVDAGDDLDVKGLDTLPLLVAERADPLDAVGLGVLDLVPLDVVPGEGGVLVLEGAAAAAMLAVLGTHEMGHKITAYKKGVDATMPYFIPGPPPFGTFGAVIMQKSLPPNKDSLFDIGADGPIAGFIIAAIVSFVGLMMLIPSGPVSGAQPIQNPILWILIGRALQGLNLLPQTPAGGVLLVQPFAFAGWVGLFVTMLNLLPAAMLDGGHVSRSILGEKPRLILSAVSVIFLFVDGVYLMAFLVLLMSFSKHPGPLDDVSSLTTGRKLIAIGLIAIFVMCIFPSLQPFG